MSRLRRALLSGLLLGTAAAAAVPLPAEPGHQIVAAHKRGQVTWRDFQDYKAYLAFMGQDVAVLATNARWAENVLRDLLAVQSLAALATPDEQAEAAAQASVDLAGRADATSSVQPPPDPSMHHRFATWRLAAESVLARQVGDDVVEARRAVLLDRTPAAFTLAHVRMIWVGLEDADGRMRSSESARARADELRARIAGGEDFAAVAREGTDELERRASGGDLGEIRLLHWFDGLRDAAYALAPGTISEPVFVGAAWIILKVENRRTLSDDEIRAELKAELVQERWETWRRDDEALGLTWLVIPMVPR